MTVFEGKLKQGVELYRQGHYEKAELTLEEVLATKGKNFDALHILGTIALHTNRMQRGADLISRALEVNCKSNVAYSNLGYALNALKRPAEALACLDRSLMLDPDYAIAHNNRGSAFKMMNLVAEAIESFERAVALDPTYAEAQNNLGNALYDLGRFEDALRAYETALKLKPEFAEAYNNRGNALQELKQLADSVASYDRAIDLRPNYPQAFSNRSSALNGLRRHAEALESVDRAIALSPDYAEAHNNRGNILNATKRHFDAIASYERAIALNPQYAEAHSNRANALTSVDQFEKAIGGYAKALAIRPGYKFLLGSLAHTQMKICQWDTLERERTKIFTALARGEKVVTPFPALGLTDDEALQRRAAEVWSADWTLLQPKVLLADKKSRAQGEKIRIGYFSADFHNHATSYLVAELFERHDRSRFEVIAVSFGPPGEDAMRKRVRAGVDKFIEVQDLSDVEIVEAARGEQIDVAVDLKGYTKDARPNIFMNRVAPVQITYLGYPGPAAEGFADYVIADPIVIPRSNFGNYAEKVIWLPDTYQVNDTKREVSATIPSRRELNLPENGFVFCCFNNPYKITPDVFDRWLDILSAVDGSVLWLLESHPAVNVNLRKVAARRGIAPERFVFASYRPLKEHLARYQSADLFLDTLPYNAHTTASDALWVGVPVLTQRGKAFAGRVAASLLEAIGMPELITESSEAYVALAIELARSPKRFAELRARLKKNRLQTALFDTQKFTRNIERAYEQTFDRYLTGLAPDHLRFQ